MLVLDDNVLQVTDEIKSYVVNVKCVWEFDAYLTAIVLFCRCIFVQDTYQNLINPVARPIYPVYAYLIQLLFLKLYFTTTYARICLFCAITFIFFVIFMTRYDDALHCPSHKRNKFSLVNQLTLDKHLFKTKLQLPQSFYYVTGG